MGTIKKQAKKPRKKAPTKRVVKPTPIDAPPKKRSGGLHLGRPPKKFNSERKGKNVYVRKTDREYSSPVGRPPVEINWHDVELLAGVQCSPRAIANNLGIPYGTLIARPEFTSIYERGWDQLEVGLRQTAIRQALEGSTTMLIFLMKAVLGFRDRETIPYPIAVSSEAKPDYVKFMTKDELKLLEQLGDRVKQRQLEAQSTITVEAETGTK